MLTESGVQRRKDKVKSMDKMEKEQGEVVAVEEQAALSGEVEDFWVIPLKKPIRFEGETYDRIDLTGLHEIKAADMVAINRRMSRSGNVDATQELTLEYALNMANLATGLPLEFFDQLPPYAAMSIKSRVTSFLFRQE